MDKDFYKAQIEKVAYIYSDENKRLHLNGNNYDKIVDVNKKQDASDESNAWLTAKNDIDNYLNTNPLKKKFLKEEEFNKKRKEIRSKHSRKVSNAISIGVPVAAGVAMGLKDKSLKSGVKWATSTSAPSVAVGKYTGFKMNEAKRNKEMGKVRRGTTKQLEEQVLQEFKGKKYGYNTEK